MTKQRDFFFFLRLRLLLFIIILIGPNLEMAFQTPNHESIQKKKKKKHSIRWVNHTLQGSSQKKQQQNKKQGESAKEEEKEPDISMHVAIFQNILVALH